jgi:hypothetical protein
MAKIKYVDCKDAASLNAIQDKAIKSVHSARTLIQIALVATILHIGKHGDYTSANRLVEGLGNTVNGRAVVEYFVKFGALKVGEDGKGFAGLVKDFPEVIKGTLDEAKATMWYDLKIQQPFKGVNLEAMLTSLINKVDKAKVTASETGHDDMVNTTVSDNTIRKLLQLANFDAILADAENADKLDNEPVAEAA